MSLIDMKNIIHFLIMLQISNILHYCDSIHTARNSFLLGHFYSFDSILDTHLKHLQEIYFVYILTKAFPKKYSKNQKHNREH